MVRQQARLDVRRQVQPRGRVVCDQVLGRRELVVVPMEDIALGADAGVAARHLKGRTGHLVRPQQLEKGLHARLRVGRVRVAHCTAGVAERPLRWQAVAAHEPGEAARDSAHGRPEQHGVVEVAARRFIRGEEAVVVVKCAAEIEGAVGRIVVEQAIGGRGRKLGRPSGTI